MDSSGARLKKIRLEKGLSLEDVHKKTKIHLNILKAIEDDNLVGMSPIYTKGFLKIYCQLLGLDPKDYVPGYQQVKSQSFSPAVNRPQERAPSLRKVYANLEILKKINFKGLIKPVFKSTVVILVILGFINLGKVFSRRRAMVPRQAHKQASVDKPAVKEAVKNDATSLKSQKASSPVSPKPVPQTLKLTLRAKDASWVHLSIDGKVAFHAILKKGKIETWEAKERIEFSLGNAGGVELELNGKIIPVLGRKGQAVKNVTVTHKDGLVVGR